LSITHQGEDAVHWAAAAVLGFSRAKFYIDTARSLMDQIMNEAEEIDWNLRSYDDLMQSLRKERRPTQITEAKMQMAAKYRLGSHALSVHAEVLWHFYASSLQHAWHFLNNCVTIVDPQFSTDDGVKDYLDLIRAFRNHMEHRDKATLNINSGDWKSMSNREQHSVTVGYRRDHRNNIIFVPMGKGPLAGKQQKMPINPEGFLKFQKIIDSIYEHLGEVCIERLESYFIAHPDDLPREDQVGGTMNEHMNLVTDPASAK
jgi:uncharacterized protein (DUF1778 family)